MKTTDCVTLSGMFLAAYRLWQQLERKAFTSLSRGAFHHLGNRSVLTPPIRLGGERHIEIGDRVFVGANSWLEVFGSEPANGGPVITIDDEASIAGFCTVTAVRRVVIERRVLIARYVYISDHAHEHRRRDLAIKSQGVTKVSPVRIGEGAWLGQGVVVCPGVTIGRNSVIGANSVVRRDVPDFCLAAGSPARVIRHVDSMHAG